MKLFISWSGELSHRIALALMDWFPYVINQVVPFVSSESIRKGERWGLDIHSELSKSRFCLVCLTRENLSEPWIMFEAGAISGSTGRSRVCAILFDGLRQKDIGAPLSLFQNSGFERDEFRKLLLSVNDSFGKKKISEAVLLKSFETWYPDLESKILNIQASYSPERPKIHEDETLLNTILKTTNYMSDVITSLNFKLDTETIDFGRFTTAETIRFFDETHNHPMNHIGSGVS